MPQYKYDINNKDGDVKQWQNTNYNLRQMALNKKKLAQVNLNLTIVLLEVQKY